jgi:uncharacterized linocin/CFP29 family protein
MDLFRQSLAPVSDEAWEQIKETASQVLRSNLSGRRVLDVKGPHGIGFAAVPTGRLRVPEGQPEDEVTYGVTTVLPLVETRIPFELDLWELDNGTRGAADLDVSAVARAAGKMADFEEKAIYHGFDEGCIVGLLKACAESGASFQVEPASFTGAVAAAVGRMARQGVGGPYALVVNPDIWSRLLSQSRGYPLYKQLRPLVEQSPVFCPAMDGAVVLSTRGGDAELVIGQDYTVGYMQHDSRKVRLFLSASFTFRVVEPAFAVPLTPA